MSDLGALFLCISVVVAAAGLVGYQDRIADQEAAKAGLQQCLATGHSIVVWQKECK